MVLLEFVEGVKVKMTAYFDNGQKCKEIEYINGERFQGLHTSWYKSGIKFSQKYHGGRNNVSTPSLSWYSDGSLRLYSDSDSSQFGTGITMQWYPNGQLSDISEELDSTTTCILHKVYHENGNLAIEYIANCGRQSFISFHDNGNKRQEGAVNGAMWNQVGRWIEFYHDGKRKREFTFDDNSPNRPIGEWKYWNDRGKLEKIEKYEAGQLIEVLNRRSFFFF